MKTLLKFPILILFLVCSQTEIQAQAEKKIDKETIHPRHREWVAPTEGSEVKTNAPAMLWPAGEKQSAYQVQLSLQKDFPANKTFTSKWIDWAAYAHHQKLANGKWYWRYCTAKKGVEKWSDTHSFVVTSQSRVFETPTIADFTGISKEKSHPKLYVSKDELLDFQTRNADNPEAATIIKRANKQINAALIEEVPTRPRDTTGLNETQKNVMMRFMYHKFGDKVKAPIKDLSMAYLLTSKKEYASAAIKQALHASTMDPKSWATSEDFNAASLMLAMAIAYDTNYEYLSADEKKQLLASIKVRGDYFYNHYVNAFETQSMDNHVWQHTLRRLFMTSLAVVGDLPEAEKWLSYCYEVWCSRFPILGADDGGWHDGNSYFQVNFATFIYIPFFLSRMTGVDFFDIPYYKNLSKYLIYSLPPNSYATGFGDGAESMQKPSKMYAGFADALARELNDPYARWYADALIENEDENLYKSADFAIYRLLTTKKKADVIAKSPKELPQAQLFRDAGFALMHNDVSDTPNDVMVSFMSLPFGATGHAHAAHNSFGVNVGGMQMFGGSGHYSNFTDAHTLTHYRTRGHNTILADGLAQVIGENGYGWIARFANTDQLSYALGDATHAYGDMTAKFWLERMAQFGVEPTKENGIGNPHITRFRRHLTFLRPNVVVIYDELEAKNPVTWTWLLHSYNPIKKGDQEHILLGENEVAKSRVDVFTNIPLRTTVSNEFFSPALNWKKRGNDNGSHVDEYTKHWHAELNTTEKSKGLRVLSIIQIKEDGTQTTIVAPTSKDNIKIGDWSIKAEMDENKPATLSVKNAKGDAVEYNTAASKIKGSTLIKTRGKVTDELVDELPESAK